MLAMKQSCPWKPGIPDLPTRELRHKLIVEEADELLMSETPEDALDAICDLLYVCEGAAIAYGFTKEQVDGAFAEVHRSNMTKLWTNEEMKAPLPYGYSAVILPQDAKNGRAWLVKTQSGKVLKSPSYSPANLKPFLVP